MEIELNELISKIKKDGVEAAEAEAEIIVASAKEKAEKIISDAKAQAEKILLNAKAENERMVNSSEDAISQAGRNLLISFRESVTRELNAILSKNVAAVYSSEALAEIIIKTIEHMGKNPDAEKLTVILSNEDLKSFEGNIISALKGKMLDGVTLKASNNLDSGFRISANDAGAYYDYSADAVIGMLSNYLSPRITALMKEA